MVPSGSKQWGAKATSTRDHPVFRDPFSSPPEIVARLAACTSTSASTKEDERTGDWEDVGSEMHENVSIG